MENIWKQIEGNETEEKGPQPLPLAARL
ncbi:hypothetical protein NC652_016397 [Populus alba x Populus x berolinensis]|uniref:Uncharacterized protein n=1 Tax=Populus alba x Populus x berolinensis TaxID=444605 RepID=A0AAD6QMJ9_9ROSI|nr:hypothetical protein NC651_015852 [Populus alba x Populus x berolinensis]KAJ6922732.1 hypothetical protein NC652_016397 [Populus alba x Populus x berolinensis]KAJ6993206.1 hypothetical protein NC653_016360 [Populus alba x Populus x berolinensis]